MYDIEEKYEVVSAGGAPRINPGSERAEKRRRVVFNRANASLVLPAQIQIKTNTFRARISSVHLPEKRTRGARWSGWNVRGTCGVAWEQRATFNSQRNELSPSQRSRKSRV